MFINLSYHLHVHAPNLFRTIWYKNSEVKFIDLRFRIMKTFLICSEFICNPAWSISFRWNYEALVVSRRNLICLDCSPIPCFSQYISIFVVYHTSILDITVLYIRNLFHRYILKWRLVTQYILTFFSIWTALWSWN